MISKRIDRKKNSTSSFGRLVNYLLDEKDNDERVLGYSINNSSFTDINLFIKEVNATQQLNQKVKSDKTYHLVLSFDETDTITGEMLKDTEEQFCKLLGFNNHQRISVVHGDTNNKHVHVVINKINPNSLKIVSPYQDKKRMLALCRKIEKKYGLKKYEQSNEKKKSPNRVDMEGFVSFEKWLIVNAKDSLKKSTHHDWNYLQKEASKFDIEFKKSGSGLAICHKKNKKLAVKASKIDRSFSYKKLKDKLGEFKESTHSDVKPVISYIKLPEDENSKKLYQTYLSESFRALSWDEWLWHKAYAEGDHIALVALQKKNVKKRKKRPDDKSTYLEGDYKSLSIPSSVRYEIKRNGDVHYKIDGSTVVDWGKGIRLTTDASDKTIAFAVAMARKRFGNNIKVSGNKKLSARIINEIKKQRSIEIGV